MSKWYEGDASVMVQGPPKSKSIEKDVVCGADVCLLSTTQRSGWPKKKEPKQHTHKVYNIRLYFRIHTHFTFLAVS